MKPKLYGIIVSILCLCVLIVVISCGGSSSEDIETSTNTGEPEQKIVDTPVSLRIPTATPEPTSTPEPTATSVPPTPTPTQIPPSPTPTNTAIPTMTPMPVMPTPDSLLMTIQAILIGDKYCKMFVEAEGDSAICKVEPAKDSILISLWTPNESKIEVYRDLVVKNFQEQGLDKLKIVFSDVTPIPKPTSENTPTPIVVANESKTYEPAHISKVMDISETYCEVFLADKSQGAICRVLKVDEVTVSIGTWLPDKWVHESANERDTQVQNFKKALLEEVENQNLSIRMKFTTVEPEATPLEDTFVGLVYEIIGFEFENISVITGTEVKWINKHSYFHTVTGESASDLLDSPQLSQGASYLFKFDKPGKYQFICKFHEDMRGVVTVTDEN